MGIRRLPNKKPARSGFVERVGWGVVIGKSHHKAPYHEMVQHISHVVVKSLVQNYNTHTPL